MDKKELNHAPIAEISVSNMDSGPLSPVELLETLIACARSDYPTENLWLHISCGLSEHNNKKFFKE